MSNACVRRFAAWAVLVCLAGAASLTRGQTAPGEYRPGPGLYDPLYADVTLHDVRRGVDVPVRLRWPRMVGEMDGPAPMVVFSHGEGGSGESFGDLTEHWASHGYVVALPTHADSPVRRRRAGVGAEVGGKSAGRALRPAAPVDRARDVALVLDSMTELERTTGVAIDRSRIAVAGHAAGALTAQMLAGARFVAAAEPAEAGEAGEGSASRERVRGRARGSSRSYADGRVRVCVLIAPPGADFPGLDERSWQSVAVPMLVIAGSAEEEREGAGEGRHAYELSPAGGKHLLFIEGATSAAYAGRRAARQSGETAPTNIDAITSAVASSTTAFLDSYLRGDAEATEYLVTGEAALHPGVRAQWASK